MTTALCAICRTELDWPFPAPPSQCAVCATRRTDRDRMVAGLTNAVEHGRITVHGDLTNVAEHLLIAVGLNSE
jgi:hypothetical protein